MTLSILLWQKLQFLGHINCLQFHFPAVIINLILNLKKRKLGGVHCLCSFLVIAGKKKPVPNQSKSYHGKNTPTLGPSLLCGTCATTLQSATSHLAQ
jgi:hypothetical protein